MLASSESKDKSLPEKPFYILVLRGKISFKVLAFIYRLLSAEDENK